MEQPVGRLPTLVPEIGRPREYFDPTDFAGWVRYRGETKTPEGIIKSNRYTKKTCLWGNYETPERRRKEPLYVKGKNGKLYSPIHFLKPGAGRWRIRSATPEGFSKAFFEANKIT